MAVNAYNQFQFNKYVPRSYQELATPIMQVAAQEEELQNTYAQNLQRASEEAAKLDPTKDKEAYNLLNSYTADIEKASSDLATKGFVDSGRKANLLSLQKRYLPSYVNISTQLNQRAQAVALQQQMALKDPTYKYKSASNISIDEAMKNPNIWNDVVVKGGISGKELQNQVAIQADAVKQTVSQQAPQLLELKTPSGEPLINEYIAKTISGASLSDVTEAINKNVKNKKLSTELAIQLSEIVDNVMDANQVHNVFDVDSEEYTALRNIASQGLYRAIGETKYTEFTDKVANMREQQRLEKDLARYNYQLQHSDDGKDPSEEGLLDMWSNPATPEVQPERKTVLKAKDELMILRKGLYEQGIGTKSDTKSQPKWKQETLIKNNQETVNSLFSKYGINPLNPDGSIRPYADLAREIDTQLYALEKQDVHNIKKFASFDIATNKNTSKFIQNATNYEGAIIKVGSKKDYIGSASSDKKEDRVKQLASGTIRFNPLEGKLYIKKGSDTFEVNVSKMNQTISNDINALSHNLNSMYTALDENGLTVNDIDNPTDTMLADPNINAILRDSKKILKQRTRVMNTIGTVLLNQK